MISKLGKQPEDKQEMNSAGIDGVTEDSTSSCIYYNDADDFSTSYQFCFENGSLDSKNKW